MDIADAMEIVLNLAREAAIGRREAEANGLTNEHKRQREALDLVEDFTVSHLGDDCEHGSFDPDCPSCDRLRGN